MLHVEGNELDFGMRAITTIMANIEGEAVTTTDRPAYIFAGYPAVMDRFLDANTGLRRRVTNTFEFKDYSSLDLVHILYKIAKMQDMVFSVLCNTTKMSELIENTFSAERRKRYNAGISEKILKGSKQSNTNRNFELRRDNLTEKDRRAALCTLTFEDFEKGCAYANDNLK